MRVLFLAPHPFYMDRGTPIAVDHVLTVLSERGADVDVITFHEGRNIVHDHVTLHRIPAIPFVHGLRPGFSWKKVVCDGMMAVMTLFMAIGYDYDVVHAVEESVYIAVVLKWITGLPYVYDMDSSVAFQMVEKYPWLSPVRRLLLWCERLAVRNAAAVAPVCEALAAGIVDYEPAKVVQIHDVPLLEPRSATVGDLRKALGIDGIVCMYVGNLEAYQGIDLLLESFALLVKATADVHLVIVGGEAADIQKYRKQAEALTMGTRVHFMGPRPISELSDLLSQSDILVSPRIRGINTPMKLYSYLASGKAVVATDLATHTQILDSTVAMLSPPAPDRFAAAMLDLIENPALRERIGRAGQRLIQEKYTYTDFRERVNGLYDWLEQQHVQTSPAPSLSRSREDKAARDSGKIRP